MPERIGGDRPADPVDQDLPSDDVTERTVNVRAGDGDERVRAGDGTDTDTDVDPGPNEPAWPVGRVAPPWENAWPDASCSEPAVPREGDWEARNCGVAAGDGNVVAVDPFDRATLYLVAGDELYRSIDRGGSWVSIHPANDAHIYNVFTSSREPGTLFASGVQAASIGWWGPGTLGNVLWRSTDLGEHWSVVNNAVPGTLVVAPSDPSVMYAWGNNSEHSSSISRSVDGGETWVQLASNAPAPKPVAAYSQPAYRLRELVVDPHDPMRYLELRGNGQVPGMPVVGTFENKIVRGATLAFDPTRVDRVYFAHPALGLLRSDHRGPWKVVNAESGNFDQLVIDPHRSSRMYLRGTRGEFNQGTFVSDDSGKHWRAVKAGDIGLQSTGLALDSSDGQRVYVSGNGGLYRSRDGLKTFELVNRGLHAVSASFDFDGHTPGLVYATTNGVVYRSLDSGRAWQRLQGPTDAVSLVTAPSSAGTAYAASWSQLFKTENGGQSWTARAERPMMTLRAVAPDNADVLYANGSTAESPYDKLLKSTDGGRTWATIPDWTGAYPFGAERIVDQVTSYAPMVVLSAQHLFVAVEVLYESTDGGASWRQVPIDLAGVAALAVDPAHPDTLYASGTVSIAEPVGAVSSALRVSSDGGVTWSAPAGAADGSFWAIYSIAVSPADGQLYMIAAAKPEPPSLHLSADRGASFERRPLDGVTSVTPDPFTACQALATTSQHGILGTRASMCPNQH